MDLDIVTGIKMCDIYWGHEKKKNRYMNVDVEICSNEDSVNFMILGQDMIIN